MKKITLKHLDLNLKEMLTREQLKSILGGDTNSTGSGTTSWHCQCGGKQRGKTVTVVSDNPIHSAMVACGGEATCVAGT